ncbi:MAG TPA: flagellar motor switch protein FliM [bacterium]|jgi:flagellar motor switch protein FliM
MAEILSQAEIDALLSALDDKDIIDDDAYEASSRRVKEYDFRRPDKFSKDQIRTIHMVLETYARNWATYLSGKLRSLVYIDIVSLDQLPYSEYIKSAFTPTVISVFSMEPLEGSAIIDLSPPVAFSIIERLVGGGGGGEMAVRELTEIEEALIENVISDALRVLKNSIGDFIQANPRLEVIEYNPQFTQIVPPSEMVLFVSLEMRIEDSRGMIGMCLPHILLEPVLKDLSTERFFRRLTSDQDAAPEYADVIMENISPTKMKIRAELGQLKLTVQDILSLEPGDVIRLPNRTTDPVNIYIGANPVPRFVGRPGIIGRYRGIEIMDFYEE